MFLCNSSIFSIVKFTKKKSKKLNSIKKIYLSFLKETFLIFLWSGIQMLILYGSCTNTLVYGFGLLFLSIPIQSHYRFRLIPSSPNSPPPSPPPFSDLSLANFLAKSNWYHWGGARVWGERNQQNVGCLYSVLAPVSVKKLYFFFSKQDNRHAHRPYLKKNIPNRK